MHRAQFPAPVRTSRRLDSSEILPVGEPGACEHSLSDSRGVRCASLGRALCLPYGQPETGRLKRSSFGLFSLSCLVVANTIGAGVYTTSGFTLGDLGTREAVLSVWLLATFVALSGAFSFGILARNLPQSGGEYLYLSRLFHPAAGFIAGWVSLLAGFAGAQAFAAIAFKAYLDLDHIPYLEQSLAVGLLVVLALTHGVLVRLGTLLQNLTVAAKAMFLFGFITIGWWQLPELGPQPAVAQPDNFWTWPMNLLWISLSFTGFNSAIYVAEECEDPARDIPRALVIGTAVTGFLYLLVNAVFMYSAPLPELAGKGNIALVSANALGGPTLRTAVQGLVLLSLFTLLSGIVVAGPRVVVKMGEDGFLPRFNLTQATAVQCAIAVTMTLVSDLQEQLQYLSLTLSVTSAATVATIFRLKNVPRAHLMAPAFYLLATGLAAMALLKNKPAQGIAALATFGSGFILYLLFFRHRVKLGDPG